MLQIPPISPEVIQQLYSAILVPLHFLARVCAALQAIRANTSLLTAKVREDLAHELKGSLLGMLENAPRLEDYSSIVARRLGRDLYGGERLKHGGHDGFAWGEVAINVLFTACWELSSFFGWARHPPSKLNEPDPPEVGWQLRAVIRIVQTRTMNLPQDLDLLQMHVRREKAALARQFRVRTPGGDDEMLFAGESYEQEPDVSTGVEDEPTTLRAAKPAAHVAADHLFRR